MLKEGLKPRNLAIEEDGVSANVKDFSVVIGESGVSCNCKASMKGFLCSHIVFLYLYLKANDYEIPESVERNLKIKLEEAIQF